VFAKAGIKKGELLSWLTYAQSVLAEREKQVDAWHADQLREGDEMGQEGEQQEQASPVQRGPRQG
jgi:hypothetical protein